jgi:hypothetical protein
MVGLFGVFMLASTGGRIDSIESFGFGLLCFDVVASMKRGGKSSTGGSFCADARTLLEMLELLESEEDPEEEEDPKSDEDSHWFLLLVFVRRCWFLMVALSLSLSSACSIA